MPDPAYGSLPFAEQIAFFKTKLNLPTERWDDLLGAAHDRAFVVAGATKADLLADLNAAVLKGIEQGTTLAEFRRDFDALVEKNGWTGWTGEGTAEGRAWRTEVIYSTNLRTSYAAGRWAQIQEVKATRPYLLYRHSDGVMTPRPEHLAWDGLALPVDDPFWKTHYPPNGWGCQCRVFAVSDQDLEKLGKAGPDRAPVPPGDTSGIGRGWDYAPGASRTRPLAELIDTKLTRLEAPIGAALAAAMADALALERDLAWKETFDDWSGTQARGRVAVVGALHPPVLDWLREHGHPQPATAEIAIADYLPLGPKQTRHAAAQNALSPDEWRALPALLRNPGAIYRDTRSGKLMFVSESLGPAKVAVEFDPGKTRKQGGLNQIVSAFRVDDMNIAGAVKGGEWVPITVPGK
ncbi:phage minor head protein [Candidatus Thiodictyon syntrophicum]|jgi:hypothetical protein|uniref:Phage head morphogenesis domain-containing protein n=1 Tax=Candidatus Thiodictyon syntrophicum TaxID=1166950 RepID=A0A2K8UHX8_9GAMM|nr:phage minor head protein [Candidatus Thiodictyon syntrophicum]AUB85158.1 hypothetical protein THSYN_30015 [Candidatus Thiodictyon syntrophicum]